MKIFVVEVTEGMMGQPYLVKAFDSEEKAKEFCDTKKREEPPLYDYYGLIDGSEYTYRVLELE